MAKLQFTLLLMLFVIVHAKKDGDVKLTFPTIPTIHTLRTKPTTEITTSANKYTTTPYYDTTTTRYYTTPRPIYDPKCCNGEPFDKHVYICCRNTLLTRVPNVRCCYDRTNNVTAVYNYYTQMCCLGKVSRLMGTRPSCCGEKSYDTRMYTCCNNVVVRKSRYMKSTSCCGVVAYDTYDMLCCRGRLYPRRSYTGCCNGRPYNYRTMLCCSGNVQRQRTRGDAKCCGRVSYDSYHQVCCNRKIFRRPSNY